MRLVFNITHVVIDFKDHAAKIHDINMSDKTSLTLLRDLESVIA